MTPAEKAKTAKVGEKWRARSSKSGDSVDVRLEERVEDDSPAYRSWMGRADSGAVYGIYDTDDGLDVWMLDEKLEDAPSVDDDCLSSGKSSKPRDTVQCTVGWEVPRGYERLAWAFGEAIDQAALGKGKRRHVVNDEPFQEQKICLGARRFGVGAPLYQAWKKTEEAMRMDVKAAKAEIMGAMNYLAAALIVLDEQDKD